MVAFEKINCWMWESVKIWLRYSVITTDNGVSGWFQGQPGLLRKMEETRDE